MFPVDAVGYIVWNGNRFVTVKSRTDKCFQDTLQRSYCLANLEECLWSMFVCLFVSFPIHVFTTLKFKKYLLIVLICLFVRLLFVYTWSVPILYQWVCYFLLSHWGPATHVCVSKLTTIASDNGLSPGRRQAIIWNNAGILSIGLLGTNFSDILIEILTYSFKKMRLKVSSAKWRPFCLDLNVLFIVIMLDG